MKSSRRWPSIVKTGTNPNLKEHELSPVPRQSSQSLESKRPKDQQSSRIKTIPGPPHSFVASSGQSTLDLRTSKSQVVVLVGPILACGRCLRKLSHSSGINFGPIPIRWPIIASTRQSDPPVLLHKTAPLDTAGSPQCSKNCTWRFLSSLSTSLWKRPTVPDQLRKAQEIGQLIRKKMCLGSGFATIPRILQCQR